MHFFGQSTHFARRCTTVIATILIALYLGVPATLSAHAASPGDGVPAVQANQSTSAAAPGDGCPCSGDRETDCCDASSCSCACHAPLGHGWRIPYAPFIATQRFCEPFRSLPQVYRTIFVPPQNLA